MKKQEPVSIKTPEDLLSLAESLAAQAAPPSAGGGKKQAMPAWVGYGLCALGGAGLTGLCWWLA